jgi:hypothetical protein
LEGNLHIENNAVLTSITGVENIQAGSIENLQIVSNTSLSDCHIQSVCDYLTYPNGTINIHDNAEGCNSSLEVILACGITSCLPNGIVFTTQAQIDSFPIIYPYCSEILGSVQIDGDEINNLNGLSNIHSIQEDFFIGTWIYPYNGNLSLNNLSGLENLKSINGDLLFKCNAALIELTGLDSLETIGGELNIDYNGVLNSLSGIGNIESGSIEQLMIRYNNSLANCDVQSICNYLASPNAIISIYNNAPGCNNPEEVLDSCIFTIVEETKLKKLITIYPNPLESNAIITYTLNKGSFVKIEFLDLSGRLVVSLVNENQQQGEHKVILNTEGLKPGVYFCTLKTNDGIQMRKIIKL